MQGKRRMASRIELYACLNVFKCDRIHASVMICCDSTLQLKPMQRGSHRTSHIASYMDPNWY